MPFENLQGCDMAHDLEAVGMFVLGFIKYIILLIGGLIFGAFFVAILFGLQAHNSDVFFRTLSDVLIFEWVIFSFIIKTPILAGLLFLAIVEGYLKFCR